MLYICTSFFVLKTYNTFQNEHTQKAYCIYLFILAFFGHVRARLGKSSTLSSGK